MLLEKTQAAQSDTASIVNSILQTQPQTEVRSRLPKLEITKFSGAALQWKTFWDQYNSSIHSSSILTNIDKFN